MLTITHYLILWMLIWIKLNRISIKLVQKRCKNKITNSIFISCTVFYTSMPIASWYSQFSHMSNLKLFFIFPWPELSLLWLLYLAIHPQQYIPERIRCSIFNSFHFWLTFQFALFTHLCLFLFKIFFKCIAWASCFWWFCFLFHVL